MHKNKKHAPHIHSTEEEGWSEKILDKYVPRSSSSSFIITLIIPVYNCSERIGETLESVKRQHYPALEVIIVDAGSTDRTLEIINSYHSLISRIYTVTDFNPYEMINRGIALASGRYITILFPGSVYLSDVTFQVMEQAIVENDFPDLVYCGSVKREGRNSPHILNNRLDRKLLRRGVQPTTLSACWLRIDLLERVGKLSSTFTIRSDYDFFCRILQQKELRIKRITRIYVEVDEGSFSYPKLVKFATDTFRIIRIYFGFWKAFIWFLGINHLNIFRWWLKNMRQKI